MTADEIEDYITSKTSDAYPHITQYWELWTVDASGTVSDEGDDTFQLCSITSKAGAYRNTTKGTFVITGDARFYPIMQDPSTLGFTQDEDFPAGGLWSTTTDPTGSLGTARSTPLKITVTVRWDTTFEDGAYTDQESSGYSVVTVANS